MLLYLSFSFSLYFYVYFNIPRICQVTKPWLTLKDLTFFPGCRATIVTANGTVSSPAYGLADYPSNQECLLRIRNPSGSALSLKFNYFNVHPSDSVQVFDGTSTSGLRLHPGSGFSGSALPKITLTASSGTMLVRFTTDALHNSKGWQAQYSAGNWSLSVLHFHYKLYINYLL